MQTVSDLTLPVPAPSALARPAWRGRMHTWAFFVTIPAGLIVLIAADGAAARVVMAIYTATLLAGFGVSAAYHRLAESPRARTIMQRLDHSMIYLWIAGTYVPLSVIALPPRWGVPLLIVVVSGAVLGVFVKMVAFDRWRWLGYSLYPILGWTAIAAAPALWRYLSTPVLVLVVAGGLLYSVGVPVLFTRRPDPWPRTFGYHEVWHGLTVAAAGLHFAAISLVVI